MRITKGNTQVDVPSWLIVLGVLVVDNITTGIINNVRLKQYNKAALEEKKIEKEKGKS